jgi:hypothetical protein
LRRATDRATPYRNVTMKVSKKLMVHSVATSESLQSLAMASRTGLRM